MPYLNYMKTINVLLTVLIITLFSCRQSVKPEDPVQTAKSYCGCLEDKFKGAKDSSVNINECNAEFAKSRFMKIHLGDNKDSFSQTTLDSAAHFFMEVGDIIDTMCLNKIDRIKIRRYPHAF
jgi:hypothetical protein